MDAIVYTSNTGYTEAYARLLSKATGLPAYTLKDAAGRVAAGAEILYMGWLMAGNVQGCKAACKRYRVRAVCAVGMAPPTKETETEARKRHALGDTPVFALQGGFSLERLHGIYRFMMSTMARTTGKKLQAKTDRTPYEDDMLQMMLHGGDHVCEANLAPVLDWWKTQS